MFLYRLLPFLVILRFLNIACITKLLSLSVCSAMRLPVTSASSLLNSKFLRIKQSAAEGRWQEAIFNYIEMERTGIHVTDPAVLHSVVKSSLKLSAAHGRCVHGGLIKRGLDALSSTSNCIMDSYAKCGDMDSAMNVLLHMREKDCVSWNVIIHGFFDKGYLEDGLWCFVKARVDNFDPNVSTLVLVISACRSIRADCLGGQVHGYLVNSGFLNVIPVQNSLLSMYADLDMDCAWNMFDGMTVRDVISWSVMVAGYVHTDEAEVGIEMFVQMVCEDNTDPDAMTMVSVLKACGGVGNLSVGRMLHGFALKRSFNWDPFVQNCLIDLYSKCKDPDSASRVFEDTSFKNTVLWNCMLSCLAHNKKFSEALLAFQRMQDEGIEPDEMTLMNMLNTIKFYRNLSWSKSIHCRVLRKGCEANEILLNSLTDAYMSCGRSGLARMTFNRTGQRNVVSWGIVISGLTLNGEPDGALQMYGRMIQELQEPNEVTILCLFEACSLCADLAKSKAGHAIAVRRVMDREVAIRTAIVDMYCKCGDTKSAIEVFNKTFGKNVITWSAMVAGYGMNGLAHEALALVAEMKRKKMKPNAVTALSVLSACSHRRMIEEGLSFFKSMVDEYSIQPGAEHYSGLIDMLGRSGNLEMAMDLIKSIPGKLEDSPSTWGSLLSSCRCFGNSEVGEDAASRVLKLQPTHSANYMLASGMYATDGMWDEAARMRKLAREEGVKVVAGYSSVSVNNDSWRFAAGDESHPLADTIKSVIKQLHSSMEMNIMDDAVNIMDC